MRRRRGLTKPRPTRPLVTDAEMPILLALANGCNFRQIGVSLGMRAGTAVQRINRLRSRCKARTVAQLLYRWGRGELHA